MANTDMYIGKVVGGSASIEDRFSTGISLPGLDASQDATLVGGWLCVTREWDVQNTKCCVCVCVCMCVLCVYAVCVCVCVVCVCVYVRVCTCFY